MNNNLVNEYYEKLFLYSSEYKTHKNIKKNKELLSFALNNIIDSHNDYLLSESIINYLSSLDSITEPLA